MKILTNGNKVDFEAPIWVEEDYFNKIISFFKKNFSEEIKVIDVKEKDRFDNPNKEPKHPKSWQVEELVLLLDPKITINELTKKLNRSGMSVKMQKAQFMPAFISWTKEKGIKIEAPNKELVEKFTEEKEK